MDKSEHSESTLERILSVLEPMGNLIVQNEDGAQGGAQGIYKDEVLFCLIDGNDVYLNAEVGNAYYFYRGLKLPFRKVENVHTILEPKAKSHDIDKFLQYAIQSYLVMEGLKKVQ